MLIDEREMTDKISLCMIMKNESENLARCLQSALKIVDETIIVDTGSSDRSIEIALSFNAHVFSHPWCNDFSLARNQALEHAAGDWVLFLDADEELSPSTSVSIRELVESSSADAYRLIMRNLQPDEDLVPYIDTRITRLFRRLPVYRYQGAIHEQITSSIINHGGTCMDAEVIILHHGYRSQQTHSGESRASRNLCLLQEALARTPEDPYLLFQTGVTLKSLSRNEDAVEYLQRAAKKTGELSDEILEQIYMKLAQLYLGFHDDEKTLKNANLCLDLNPDNIPALYAAGLALFSGGQQRASLPFFEKLSQFTALKNEDRQQILQAVSLIKDHY